MCLRHWSLLICWKLGYEGSQAKMNIITTVCVWLCGCVVVWLCGCVVVWLCVCVSVQIWREWI